MLKINKILSKKIQFSLSLRGLFPFCHSRESGNPSSLSLRGSKQRSNLSGFSLIELMVALVILAMVVFGIFLAFSTGFQGMADARDRTEAVNYIQKTLEEYKNTSFNKIIDKPMRQIDGTIFSNGSIVIDISEPGEEIRLKKIITQVRWTARNGDIKLEEASMLIYSVEKTGELLSASEIVLYASPYFRILPSTYTSLFAEIHDANGNIVTDEIYKVNFAILSGDADDLGYLAPPLEDTTNGIASVKYWSYEDSDGSESVQASADLDGDGSDDVFDTITITISTGAEGIILVPVKELAPVEDSVEINLYIVDASFDYLLEGGSHIIPYDGEITLSVSEIGTLSTTTITATDGTASFTLNSNGTPGTVEIIASAPDLDLGYTEVTFTGGAQYIQLTPKDGSIYEGESIEITITILDENLNPTPLTGYISIASDSGGSFNPESPIEFVNVSSETVDFSHNVASEGIEITATGEGLIPDSINIAVLESLTPLYIELSAIPSNVEANDSDYSFITATVYDDSDPSEIVTNYTTPITFTVSGDAGYFLNEESIQVNTIDVDPSHGEAWVSLYSDSSGTATVTATSGALVLDSINIAFYSSASYIFLTTNSTPVVANGEDYAVITATVYDANGIIVTNYLYDIIFSVSGVGYLGDENPITPTLGIAQVNLYSNDDGTATVDASSNDLSQPLLLEADAIEIEFTQSAVKNIILTADPIERYSAGHGNDEYVKFYIEVTGSNISLNSMKISWDDSSSRNLIEIAIKSPTTVTNYIPVISIDNASSPYTTNVITTLYEGKSAIRLKFSKSVAGKTIEVIFYDNEEPSNSYPLTPPMQIVVPN